MTPRADIALLTLLIISGICGLALWLGPAASHALSVLLAPLGAV